MLMFHGSPEKDITIFTPRISTHGRPLIYATDRMDSAILFCAKWNDFMITCGSDDVIVERYAGAFDALYKDKAGYIYILDGSAFRPLDDIELVSEVPVKVLDCVTINNLYDVVTAKYTVYRYPDRPAWIPDDDGDIVPHAMRIYGMCGDTGVLHYVRLKFPHLKDAVDRELKKISTSAK